MKQNMVASFQVIGRCAKMQTISLEDELRLVDGVPYCIDFSQEYPIDIFDEATLKDAPVPDIIDAILSPPKVSALPVSTVQNCSPIDWDTMNKKALKEIKHEKKWKKNHKKPSAKEAIKNHSNLMKEWGIW